VTSALYKFTFTIIITITMPLQFVLGRPGLLLNPGTSQYSACCDGNGDGKCEYSAIVTKSLMR